MFNPSDLEGEVDHSFFDSDCEAGSTSRDGEKMEKGLKDGKGIAMTHAKSHTEQTENTKANLTPGTDGTKHYLKPLDSNREKRKERSRTSSVSSVSCMSDKGDNNVEDNSRLHSKRQSLTFMALLADNGGASAKDTEYSHSPYESDEGASPSRAKQSKERNKQSHKKRVRSRRMPSPSPTSTESSADTDSESSLSRRSDVESPTPSKPNHSSYSTGVRRERVGSAGSRDVDARRTEESDDTVTDVSPLSSPDTSSSLQLLDLNDKKPEDGNLKKKKQEERQEEEEEVEQVEEDVPSSGLSNIHEAEEDADDYSLRSDSQFGERFLRCPGGRNRKNFSFTNDEVRSIDRENQRLLRELSRLSSGSRAGSSSGKKSRGASSSPCIHLSHSALNRQREQQRIKKENLAFLKRLETVKATPGLKRTEQLADYQRLLRYPGAPACPIYMPISPTGSSASNTPPGLRSVSSARHSSRTVSSTDSIKTPVPRSKKPGAARPAWC